MPALAFWAENDHCAVMDDHRVLLRRWEAAANGKLSWHVLDGATHSVEEDGPQGVLCDKVVRWLAKEIVE